MIDESQMEKRYTELQETIRSEVELCYNERHAEIGMALFLTLKAYQYHNNSPEQIMDGILLFANELIARSPERAFEFEKEFLKGLDEEDQKTNSNLGD